MDQIKKALKGLIDFKFQTFVTSEVIKILYFIALIGAVFMYLGIVSMGFKVGAFMGSLVLLIIGPLTVLFYLLFARVSLEVLIIIFSIHDRLSEIGTDVKLLTKEESK